MVKFAAVPLTHAMCRPHLSGAAHVPRTGPAILAANHLSVIDSFLLPALLPRHVTFAAKNEYFSGNPVSSWFMRLGGSLPTDRESARAAQEMLDAAAGLLERGELFGIHPEGTRSPDGRLYRGKVGVAWLALKTGAPRASRGAQRHRQGDAVRRPGSPPGHRRHQDRRAAAVRRRPSRRPGAAPRDRRGHGRHPAAFRAGVRPGVRVRSQAVPWHVVMPPR
ncbi:lysophospholipid acyltransferase family protein [Nonomuraea ferruginea]